MSLFSSIFGGSSTKFPSITNLTEQEVKAFQQAYPQLMDALQAEMPGQAQLETDIQVAQMPQIAQLLTDLYGNYGVQLNDIGNQIDRSNQLAQAETNLAVMQGPGKQLIEEALNTARQSDPEYYKTRALVSDALSNLVGSIDLKGGLSPTEREEISRSLAQEGALRGTANSPSQLDTVGNAMQFGAAGRERVMQNQDALTRAISAATAFLPASNSGIDTFQIATGGPSRVNPGTALFTGITAPNGNAAGQFLQQAYNSASTKTGAQSSPYTKQSSSLFGGLKTIGDTLSSFNIGSSGKGMFGMY
jgi:hypothetical protein